MACGICGEVGHNRRSCSGRKVEGGEPWPLFTEAETAPAAPAPAEPAVDAVQAALDRADRNDRAKEKTQPEVSPASIASQLTDLTGQREGALSRDISLTFEDEVLKRLDAQVAVVSQGAAAREFGIKVTREVVARVALLRGLSVMETGGVVMERPQAAGRAAKEEAPPADEAPSVEYASDGVVRPPDGWRRWSGNELVPPSQSKMHDYYITNGWWRYGGKAGDADMTFYWTSAREAQELPEWVNTDANGKHIIVQQTPWGPGHIVPHGWAG